MLGNICLNSSKLSIISTIQFNNKTFIVFKMQNINIFSKLREVIKRQTKVLNPLPLTNILDMYLGRLLDTS